MTEPKLDSLLAQVERYAQSGLQAEATQLCQEILNASPTNLRAWQWLAILALGQGRLQEAERAYRQVISLEPGKGKNWSDLGAALFAQERYSEAEACFRRAIALSGPSKASTSNLAASLMKQQKWNEAAHAFYDCIGFDNRDADIWSNLARVEMQRGELLPAKTAYEHAMQLDPSPDDAVDFAGVLVRLKELPLAIHVLHQVTSQVPTLARAWEKLGQVLSALGDAENAMAAYRRALELSPQLPDARYHLGMLLLQNDRKTTDAKRLISGLLADNPRNATAMIGLGLVELARGNQANAISRMQSVVELEPTAPHKSQLLQTMQYSDGVSPDRLLSAHQEWEQLANRKRLPAPARAIGSQSATNCLRIGFVSPDFCRHPVSFLVLPLLEQLKAIHCATVCYSDRVGADTYTQRFKSAADCWHAIAGLSDEATAEMIRKDEIDVLFDLAGHFGARLPVFMHKPAPVQVTWLGYVGTTGLSTMDYLLADRYHVREDEERYYTEKILRMPNDYACYGPPDDAPEIVDLPAKTQGHITFGSFNGPQKLTPRTIETWAAILHRVPASRLFLKSMWLGEREEQQSVHDRFQKHGIAPGRVRIEGWSPQADLLAAYGQVDIGLDTQPYSGGLTTCEALWMGVPVITFPGKTFAGRHSTSHVTNAGYPQFVADDVHSYIELAVSWANRLDELAAIRSRMRDQLQQSALCDALQFARDFLTLVGEACQLRSK